MDLLPETVILSDPTTFVWWRRIRKVLCSHCLGDNSNGNGFEGLLICGAFLLARWLTRWLARWLMDDLCSSAVTLLLGFLHTVKISAWIGSSVDVEGRLLCLTHMFRSPQMM